MKVRMRIERVMFPASLAEWRDFVIAEVHILECSGKPEWVGTIQTFKGNLPSRAPYFIFETRSGPYVKHDAKYSHQEVLFGGKDTRWSYTRNLTVKGLVYILTQEFPLAAAREDAVNREFVASRALDEVRRMVQQDGLMMDDTGKIDEDTFQALPVFKQAVARSCDYFRLEFVEPLRHIYDRGAQAKLVRDGGNRGHCDQMRQLQVMPPGDLVKLYNMSRNSPWLLMLRRFSRKRFGMKPVRLVDVQRLMAQHNVRTPNRIMVAMRLLDHIRRHIYSDGGHTVFYMLWVYTHYLNADVANSADKPMMKSATDWLIANGALKWVRRPDLDNADIPGHERLGVAAFSKTVRHVQIITDTFLKVANRAHGLSVGDRTPNFPSARNGAVIKIPPPLTDEQTRGVLHFWNNWCTLITGAPGRGKTAAIEAIFAETFGITNITYVGTMVASQRERLGGRVESSHTAHAFYKTMRSNPPARRDHYLRQVEVLVWDEYSNVGESLMANVMQCFLDCEQSPLCRMVFVFDIHQINPINPSCCAKDLFKYLPEHLCEFTVNLRVDPVYRSLAELAIRILRQQIDQIEFGTDLFEGNHPVILRDVSTRFTGDEPFVQTPGFDVVRQAMRYFRIKGGITDPMQFKFITPTRKMRQSINDAVEILLFEEDWIDVSSVQRRVMIRRNFDIYPGAIIAISGATFKPPKQKLADNIEVDEVRNGQILRVARIRVYQDEQRRIYDAYYVEATTRSGVVKRMVFHKNVHVDPIHVKRGNCGTIDANQGSEYTMTCVVLPEGAESHTWLTMERLYVACSRARKGMIIVAPGGRETLKRIASRQMPARHSALGYALANDPQLSVLNSAVDPDEYSVTSVRNPDEMVLLTDERIAAVPRFPANVNMETDGTGNNKRRRRRR